VRPDHGATGRNELTVLCRLLFWVLTAPDEALTRLDQQKLGVVYGLFHAELALLREVTTRMAEEARGRGLTDEAIGPLLEAQVYREFLHQPYPPAVRPGEDRGTGGGPGGAARPLVP
jgi:hypothetical protein